MKRIMMMTGMMVIVLACAHPKKDVIFNVRDLIGKDDKGVIAVLGQPDTSYYKNILGHHYFIQQYQPRETEIRHLKGHVAEVIINKPYDLPFDQHAIERYGLEATTPTSADTNAMIIWKDIPDFKSVTLFKVGTKKIDSVKTQYKIYFNLN